MSMIVKELDTKTTRVNSEDVNSYKCTLTGKIDGVDATLTLKSIDRDHLASIVRQRVGEDVEVDISSYNTSLDSFAVPVTDERGA